MIVAHVVVCKLSERALEDEGYRGLVRCTACGHTQRVRMFHCLRTGWPEHCGSTMELVREEAKA